MLCSSSRVYLPVYPHAITHVESNVCSNVIYKRTVSAISVSIPPVRHALVATVELENLNCRHSNVIGGIRDNNVTFYTGRQ